MLIYIGIRYSSQFFTRMLYNKNSQYAGRRLGTRFSIRHTNPWHIACVLYANIYTYVINIGNTYIDSTVILFQ